MDIKEALYNLDVRDDTLTPEEKAQLDRDGYLPLDDILSPELVAKLGKRLDELTHIEGEKAGLEVHQEAGTDRLADLVNKDPMFDIAFTHPRVLAAMYHVLRSDFKLSALNSRASLPGHGLQGIHADWGKAVEPGDYYVCNSIWLLDDFTEQNGATRVVPGSHRSGKLPSDVQSDTKEAFDGEIKLLASAGIVVIFNSHLWHGGTLNTSPNRRRALHSYFCRRDQKQLLDERQYIRPETYNRLSEAARYILDV